MASKARESTFALALGMAFHFPFESLLHLRRSLERQQELRLRAANQQVAKVRHLLDRSDRQLGEMRIQHARQLQAGETIAELRFAATCEAALVKQRRVIEQELARLERLRDQQQQIFHKARLDRETLESLRQHQFAAYERAGRRREQRLLDDLFLLRQIVLRRSGRRSG